MRTANEEFVKEVSGWTFKELGVLKVGSIAHFLDEGKEHEAKNASELNPKIYRVKNTVVSNSYSSGVRLSLLMNGSPTALNSPSTSGTNMFHTLHQHLTTSSSSSACFRLSTVSTWCHPSPRHFRPFTLQHSSCRINMESSTSLLIIEGRSLPWSRRKTRSPSVTLRMMSGTDHGRLVRLGRGLVV